MKHLIIGTAGHVDHGKTTLVKALTGKDCDTHPQEKQRGITINLGFSYLDMPSGSRFGIIDVPGHRDFIHTMVGGAFGLDFVILVVAADAGVMPQTREHLQIMDALGICRGLVVLSRIDLADAEMRELAREEVRELVAGTFLEFAPIVEVDAVHQEGILELISVLDRQLENIPDREPGERFRMFVDRVFSVVGHGTIVTGTVIQGTLSQEASVYVYPGSNDAWRLRRMERYDQEVDSVQVGDRASINLVGIEIAALHRGSVLTDCQRRPTGLLDVRLRLFTDNPPLQLWTNAIFYAGTMESQARIHLLDRDILISGETALAQITLEQPSILQNGDRFILRNSSGQYTLGGGEIVDATPLHHRRRTPRMIQQLTHFYAGDRTAYLAAEVRKRYRPVRLEELAMDLNFPPDSMLDVLAELPEEIRMFEHGHSPILVLKQLSESLSERILKAIAAQHRRNPYDSKGIKSEELRGKLGIQPVTTEEQLLLALLQEQVSLGILKQVDDSWALADHRVQLTAQQEQWIRWLEQRLKSYGLQVPLWFELIPLSQKQGITEGELRKILNFLVRQGKAYRIEDDYIHASVVNGCREAIAVALARTPDGLTVAQFRDLVDGNRKLCLLLFALFDQEGLTRREGDRRVLNT